MKKFEYMIWEFGAKGVFSNAPNINNMHVELNKYGAEGWEVVSSSTTSLAQGETRSMVVILKREIAE